MLFVLHGVGGASQQSRRFIHISLYRNISEYSLQICHCSVGYCICRFFCIALALDIVQSVTTTCTAISMPSNGHEISKFVPVVEAKLSPAVAYEAASTPPAQRALSLGYER